MGERPPTREEFEQLVAHHRPALRARAVQLCRGHGDADDLLQDALLRAFLARAKIRDPARTRGWLLVILTNTFLDSVRRRKVRPKEVSLEIDPATPAAEHLAPWLTLGIEDIRAAVPELSEDVRDTYRMFALEGRDYVAIANVLGIAKATVGTRILRARKQLRELLMARTEERP